nr:hypothetical protein BaRGS_001506 [Batillaria attramentaria]KAG5686482.1 hypothetical protein BaRGS_018734 [Batillaria attramentaria]
MAPDGKFMEDQGHLKDVKDGAGRLGLGRKLLVVAEFLGVESSMTYEQLYLIPILQSLGMPLSLASLVGLVSGPVGAVLVPVFGWLSDRGSNPNRRKLLGVVFSTGLLLLDTGVPFTAGLAMFGFIVYEVGYDQTSSVVRAWILTCSPHTEHTSLLVLGLVMAGLGMIVTSALGRVDFPSLCNRQK